MATPRGIQQGPQSLRLLPVHLAATVAAASTARLEYPVQQDATVVALRIRIYRGTELDLRIVPKIVNARGQDRALVQFVAGGKQYIDGDDDTYVYALSEPVSADSKERIVFDATNIGAYPYDFAADISLDFANGQYPGVMRNG